MKGMEAQHVPLSAVTTAAACGVPGLSLLLDFVTAEEEALLLAAVDGGGAPWTVFARRRVQHYGYAFNYVVSRHRHRHRRRRPRPGTQPLTCSMRLPVCADSGSGL